MLDTVAWNKRVKGRGLHRDERKKWYGMAPQEPFPLPLQTNMDIISQRKAKCHEL